MMAPKKTGEKRRADIPVRLGTKPAGWKTHPPIPREILKKIGA